MCLCAPDGAGGAALEETWADVGEHGFWRQWTTALFDVCRIDLDAGSYLHMMPEKALENSEKENKDK